MCYFTVHTVQEYVNTATSGTSPPLGQSATPPFLTENLYMQTTAGIIISTSYAIGSK